MQKFDLLSCFIPLLRPSTLVSFELSLSPSTQISLCSFHSCKTPLQTFLAQRVTKLQIPGVLTYNAKRFISLFLISLSGLVNFSFQREFQFSENNILYFLCAFAVFSACMLIDWEVRNLDCKNFSLWCWWMADTSQSHSCRLADFSTVCGYVLSFSQWIAVWGA